MKKWIAITTLAGMIAVALFGFVAMDDHAGNATHHGCLAATAQGPLSCPARDNAPLAPLLFHLSAFQHFSQGILEIFAVTGAVIMLFGLGVLLLLRPPKLPPPPLHAYYLVHRRASTVPHLIRLRQWLLMREKRDPLIA